MARASATQKPTSGLWTRISARVVLMLGFAYAASWWADQRFYSHFGIAPQDVGLTPSGGLSDIIGAIVRLGLWVAIALLLLGALPVLAVSAAGFAIEARTDEWSARRNVAIAAVLIGLAAFGAYGWLTGWIYAAAAGSVLLLALWSWWFFSPTRQHALPAPEKPPRATPTWPQRLEEFAQTRSSWSMKVLDVFSIIAVIGLLLVDLPDDASKAASCVVKTPGYAVKGIGAPLGFVHLILLDVYAQPATIAWIGGQPPASIDQNPFRGTYLGTSSSTAVIYQQGDPSRLLRLPASDITLTLNPTAPTCKEAH